MQKLRREPALDDCEPCRDHIDIRRAARCWVGSAEGRTEENPDGRRHPSGPTVAPLPPAISWGGPRFLHRQRPSSGPPASPVPGAAGLAMRLTPLPPLSPAERTGVLTAWYDELIPGPLPVAVWQATLLTAVGTLLDPPYQKPPTGGSPMNDAIAPFIRLPNPSCWPPHPTNSWLAHHLLLGPGRGLTFTFSVISHGSYAAACRRLDGCTAKWPNWLAQSSRDHRHTRFPSPTQHPRRPRVTLPSRSSLMWPT